VHFWRIRKDGGLYAHESEPKTLLGQSAAQSVPAAVKGAQ